MHTLSNQSSFFVLHRNLNRRKTLVSTVGHQHSISSFSVKGLKTNSYSKVVSKLLVHKAPNGYFPVSSKFSRTVLSNGVFNIERHVGSGKFSEWVCVEIHLEIRFANCKDSQMWNVIVYLICTDKNMWTVAIKLLDNLTSITFFSWILVSCELDPCTSTLAGTELSSIRTSPKTDTAVF